MLGGVGAYMHAVWGLLTGHGWQNPGVNDALRINGTNAEIYADAASQQSNHWGEYLFSLDGISVYRAGNVIQYGDGDLSIDFDGAPNAYAPIGFGMPLDALRNAGSPGNWSGILTDTGKKDGNPIIQELGEPFPGYYISTTALSYSGRSRTQRYVDASRIPFLALPPVFIEQYGVMLGDIALVSSTITGKSHYAIIADVGPRKKLGEGSYYLAQVLGAARSSERKNGINVKIFLNSGTREPLTDSDIQQRGSQLVQAVA